MKLSQVITDAATTAARVSMQQSVSSLSVLTDETRFEAEVMSLVRKKVRNATKYTGPDFPRQFLRLIQRCKLPSDQPTSDFQCRSPFCPFCRARRVFELTRNLCHNRLVEVSGQCYLSGTVDTDIVQLTFDHEALENVYCRDATSIAKLLTLVLDIEPASEVRVRVKQSDSAVANYLYALKEANGEIYYIVESSRVGFRRGEPTLLSEVANRIGQAFRFPPAFWDTRWYWSATAELVHEAAEHGFRFSNLRGCFRKARQLKRVASDSDKEIFCG